MRGGDYTWGGEHQEDTGYTGDVANSTPIGLIEQEKGNREGWLAGRMLVWGRLELSCAQPRGKVPPFNEEERNQHPPDPEAALEALLGGGLGGGWWTGVRTCFLGKPLRINAILPGL